jgi:hypothetical protein
MANSTLGRELMQDAVNAVAKHGSVSAAAKALKMNRLTLNSRYNNAVEHGVQPNGERAKDTITSLHTTVKRLEIELKRATSESADARTIKAIIGTLDKGITNASPPAWLSAPLAKSSHPGVPTLFLSDLHWGENVRPSQIGGVNSFNIVTARERLHYTVETAIHLLKILDPDMNYPGIVVPLGGDMISGNLHEELSASNDLNSMPTVLDLYDHLVGAIKRLADVFGNVRLPCVTGNHGRDTRKIWSKDRHHTSFDWLLYQFLARHFKDDPRVSFFIPDGSDALYRIYNVRYNLTHGDQFRGGDSIIGPLGPLTRGNQKKQARSQAIDQPYDVMICGHWHSYIHLERLIVNGSMKGFDEYAYTSNFGYEPPRQALWVTHERYGITYRMPVLCEKPPKHKPTAEWMSVSKAQQPRGL